MLVRDQFHGATCLALAGALTGILMLTGCSSLNEKECRAADWRMIGYEDAVSGKKTARLGDHRTACAEYSIAPKLDAYRSGYEDGLKEYCRPSAIFQLGRSGSAYPSQCPEELADQLKISYRYGRNIYDLNADIRNMQRLLTAKQRELKQAEKLRSEYKAELVTKGTSTAHRVELLEKTMDLSKQIDAINAEIDDLNFKLTTRQTQLNRLVSVLQ